MLEGVEQAPSILNLAGQVTRAHLWAPLAVVVAHIFLGGWLGHEPYVDPVMHLLGGVAAAYFFWQSSRVAGPRLGRPTPAALALIAFGMASAAAVCWEFGEFLRDALTGTQMQKGVANTMRDLAYGHAGAALYVAARWLRR